MSLRIVRGEFERVAKEVGGERPALLFESKDAEVVVGTGVGWIEAERAEIESLCSHCVAGRELQVALREIDFRILRRIGVGEVELAAGEGKVLRFQCLQA